MGEDTRQRVVVRRVDSADDSSRKAATPTRRIRFRARTCLGVLVLSLAALAALFFLGVAAVIVAAVFLVGAVLATLVGTLRKR